MMSFRDQKANQHARAAAAARTEATRARIEAEFDAAPDAFPLAAHAFRHGLTVDAADPVIEAGLAHLRTHDTFRTVNDHERCDLPCSPDCPLNPMPPGYVPWGDEVADGAA